MNPVMMLSVGVFSQCWECRAGEPAFPGGAARATAKKTKTPKIAAVNAQQHLFIGRLRLSVCCPK